MLNPSKIISSIKMDLGIVGIHMPFDNVDELIMEIIKVKTIPVFNEMQPNKVPLVINTENLEVIERKIDSKIFKLPDVFGDKEIMMILDMQPTYDEYHQSAYGGDLYAYGSNMCYYGYQDLMLAQANSNVLSAVTTAPTCKFIPPNKIEIFNDYGMSGMYRLEIALEHADNLSTIPSTCYTSFMQLATLDAKKYMFDNLKHYDQLSTTYGQLSLRIEDWSGAEADRQQLIEKWSQTYHLDLNQYIII